METIEATATTITQKSIVVVFDRSGSMPSMKSEPVQSLNAFYLEQKKTDIPFRSTLILFNDNVTFHHMDLEGKEVPPLSEDDYEPSGMTALYDAIGKGIDYQNEKNNDDVIFVILTDGCENCSHEYDNKTIKKKITECEKKGWKFIYLGANQDAFSVANNIGINISSNYEYTPAGLNGIMRSVSNEVARTISGVHKNMDIKLEIPKDNVEDDDDKEEDFIPPPQLLRSTHI